MNVDLDHSRALAIVLEQFSKTAGPSTPSFDFSEAMIQMTMAMQKKAVGMSYLKNLMGRAPKGLLHVVESGGKAGRSAAKSMAEGLGHAEAGAAKGIAEGASHYKPRGVWRQANLPEGARKLEFLERAAPTSAAAPKAPAPKAPAPKAPAPKPSIEAEGMRAMNAPQRPAHLQPPGTQPQAPEGGQGWLDWLTSKGEGFAEGAGKLQTTYDKIMKSLGQDTAKVVDPALLAEQAKNKELADELMKMKLIGGGAAGMFALDRLLGGGGGGQPPVIYKM